MNLRELIKKHEENRGQGVKFFKLADNGDSAVIRFLHAGENDLQAYEVHRVEINGQIKSVKCLGNDCPLCRTGNKPQLRIWLFLINKSENNELQVWERGMTEIKTIIGLIDEVGNLNERDYKIVRQGKKGSTSTTYQFFYKDKEQMELPQTPKALGRFVLELSKEEMQKLANGEAIELGTKNTNEDGFKEVKDATAIF